MEDKYSKYADIAKRYIYAGQHVAHVEIEMKKALHEDLVKEAEVWGLPKDAFGKSYSDEIDSSQNRLPLGFTNWKEKSRRLGYTLEKWQRGEQDAADPLEGETEDQWIGRLQQMIQVDMWNQFLTPPTPAEENRMRERMKEGDFPYNMQPEHWLYKERTKAEV